MEEHLLVWESRNLGMAPVCQRSNSHPLGAGPQGVKVSSQVCSPAPATPAWHLGGVEEDSEAAAGPPVWEGRVPTSTQGREPSGAWQVWVLCVWGQDAAGLGPAQRPWRRGHPVLAPAGRLPAPLRVLGPEGNSRGRPQGGGHCESSPRSLTFCPVSPRPQGGRSWGVRAFACCVSAVGGRAMGGQGSEGEGPGPGQPGALTGSVLPARPGPQRPRRSASTPGPSASPRAWR